MSQPLNNTETSIPRILWGVFGYSFVGFTSLIYGVSLQLFNMKDIFPSLLVSQDSFRTTYLAILLLIILLNLLFCHAYASLYLKDTSVDDIIYHKIGHWIETILLIVFMAYLIPTLINSNNDKNILYILLIISIPWCTCIITYRTFLVYCKHHNYDNKTSRTKYRLIVPSFLLIASNIYVGASICEIWLGQVQYIITYLLLLIFIVFYCIIEVISFKISSQKMYISPFDQYAPHAYLIILTALSFITIYLNHYQKNDLYYIPMRTLFLASFVALYLSLFEGWFLIRNERNSRLEKNTQYILHYMPMLVFILFPVQQFQLIFWGLFVIGHLSAWCYWRSYTNNPSKKPLHMAIARGILGTLTLISLIIDKWSHIDVTTYVTKFIHVNNIMDVNKVLAVIGGVITISKFFFSKAPSENLIDQVIKNKRILLYIAIIFALLYIYPNIVDIEPARIFLSLVGCLIFILFEICIEILPILQKETAGNE